MFKKSPVLSRYMFTAARVTSKWKPKNVQSIRTECDNDQAKKLPYINRRPIKEFEKNGKPIMPIKN